MTLELKTADPANPAQVISGISWGCVSLGQHVLATIRSRFGLQGIWIYLLGPKAEARQITHPFLNVHLRSTYPKPYHFTETGALYGHG
ncbi:MAG: hypothetical protein ACPGPS_08035 [Rubripirellula sp.]